VDVSVVEQRCLTPHRQEPTRRLRAHCRLKCSSSSRSRWPSARKRSSYGTPWVEVPVASTWRWT